MKLFLVSQNHDPNWDTYASAVVAASSAEVAKTVNPWSEADANTKMPSEWADPTLLRVQLLGSAVRGTKKGVICAEFRNCG